VSTRELARLPTTQKTSLTPSLPPLPPIHAQIIDYHMGTCKRAIK